MRKSVHEQLLDLERERRSSIRDVRWSGARLNKVRSTLEEAVRILNDEDQVDVSILIEQAITLLREKGN